MTAEAKRLIAEGAPVNWQNKNGAPVDWQNGHGQAPLHGASGGGNTETVMLLLRNKCDVNVTTEKGHTPLICATRNNNMTIARELVWSDCDLEKRDEEGKTAAEVAREKGHDALAEYLASQAPREQVRFASFARAMP